MNLKDLAATLGLSQTTVSRALNGYPEVSEATRKRVHEAAREHGYRPDSRARSLATGRAMAVGLVLTTSARQEIVNPVFADFVASAAETLAARGYDIVMSLVTEAEQTAVYRSLLRKGRVDGLIMQAPLTGDARIGILHKIGLPFVVHGRVSDHDEAYSWMDMDNRHAFHTATDHLLDLGHRDIALINGIEDMDFAHRRREGFIDALAARNLRPRSDLMASAAMTESYGHDTAQRLLAQPQPPTAFLASSMLVGMGVHRAIREAGLQMGQDVSVVVHDDGLSYLPNGTPEQPLFTATHSPVRQAGHLCAEMLLRLIADPSEGPIHTKLQASFLAGPSTGPAPIQ
ncbi:LacI family DNA-binding transcriptional regulator [Tropicimonas sediminicola]|uniref:Transcriptional regulator, LacI family n=1 Tax=Tropicimonas sediminicola TaxID=1031541 RepID=A0A239K701_9RHOB|nr:substrate-binding domain-containing protein [Tropicimonas sediminicola]SNT13462.1 transcriptional regulator, LacI family [Tropicimonas sediminicola]